MLNFMKMNWWILFIRGIIALFFGLGALLLPGITLFTLIMLFGIYVLVDGAVNMIVSYNHRERYERWWMMMLQGALSVFVGIVTLLWPSLTGFALLYIVAFWALATGMFELMAAIQLRKEIESEWWLGLSGILSVILSFFLIISPSRSALALVQVIGAYAILLSVVYLVMSFYLRDDSVDEFISQRSS